MSQQQMPEVVWQPVQQRQFQQQYPLPTRLTKRSTPARVTRVLGDLLVFIETRGTGSRVGLVFKPDKIDDYRGEKLAMLGIVLGAVLDVVEWDSETRLVSRVVPPRPTRGTTPTVGSV